MYGGWTEYVVLWTNFLGFIWDIYNISTTYNYWVWAQSLHLKSWILVGTFLESFYLNYH